MQSDRMSQVTRIYACHADEVMKRRRMISERGKKGRGVFLFPNYIQTLDDRQDFRTTCDTKERQN